MSTEFSPFTSHSGFIMLYCVSVHLFTHPLMDFGLFSFFMVISNNDTKCFHTIFDVHKLSLFLGEMPKSGNAGSRGYSVSKLPKATVTFYLPTSKAERSAVSTSLPAFVALCLSRPPDLPCS